MAARVWADFNNVDEQGRVRLSTTGSLADLAQLPQLEPGMSVTAHDSEVEVDVVLERDGPIWVGVMVSDYRDVSKQANGE